MLKITQDSVQPGNKSCGQKYMWRLVMETQQGLILETTTKQKCNKRSATGKAKERSKDKRQTWTKKKETSSTCEDYSWRPSKVQSSKPPQKCNKRSTTRTIRQGRQKERPKKGQKINSPQEPRKRRKSVPLVVGSYLTHGPSSVVCMQISTSNNNGSNLAELVVIINKNRPLQVGSGFSDPVPTNAPSKKSCFGFFDGNLTVGEFGVS
jgi:hypothetical protein